MENKEDVICKVCMSANVDVKPAIEFSDDPLGFTEVSATCASVQAGDDPLEEKCCKCSSFKRNEKKIKTECEEVYIEETTIVNIFTSKEDYLTKHSAELETESEAFSLTSLVTKETPPILQQKNPTEGKPFKCDICDLQFLFASKLKYHKQTHVLTNLKPCNHCSKNYNQSLALKKHQEKHTDTCYECDKQFPEKSSLNLHNHIHPRDRVYRCDHKVFYNVRDLKKTAEKSYNCDICYKDFCDSDDLEIHHREHTQLKPHNEMYDVINIKTESEVICIEETNILNIKCDYKEDNVKSEFEEESEEIGKKSKEDNVKIEFEEQSEEIGKKSKEDNVKNEFEEQSEEVVNHKQLFECYTCNKRFRRKENLVNHLKIHSGVKRFKCVLCDAEFMQKYALKRHKLKHAGNKGYKCGVCSKDFYTLDELKRHLASHTEEGSTRRRKSYKCDVCSKDYYVLRALKRHLMLHAGVKPFKCEICDGEFTQASSLKIHRRRHTMEKPYTCDICKKAFTNSGDLKKHERTHTGEKPYRCGVCSRAFSNSSDLHRHMKTHTGEKAFKCEICNSHFTQSSSLKSHIRRHKMEKPYQCGFCSKAFTNKGEVNRHERTHTGEKPYKCDICSKAFKHSGNVKRHMITHA